MQNLTKKFSRHQLIFNLLPISVRVICSVLKYVTMTTSLAPEVDRSSPLDKEIQDQEKSVMESMKVRYDFSSLKNV